MTSGTTVVNTNFCELCLLPGTCIFEVPEKVAEALKTHIESTIITYICSKEKAMGRKV